MSRVLCWDLEIAMPVSEHPGGWDAARRGECGISALVIHDSDSRRFHIYDSTTLDEAVDHLNSADLLVGYNTLGFDQHVLAGVTGRYITVPQYDILDQIWRANKGRAKGYKLQEVVEATLGLGKSGSGAAAPTLVAQRRFAELFDYCLNDVHLVRELLSHIENVGWVKGAPDVELFLEQPPIKEYA